MDRAGKRQPGEWENDEARNGKGRRHWPVTLCFSELRSIDAVQHRTQLAKTVRTTRKRDDLKKKINKYVYVCVHEMLNGYRWL